MGGVCLAWAGTREGPSEPKGEEGLVAESLLQGCLPEKCWRVLSQTSLLLLGFRKIAAQGVLEEGG